jgi:uncharacterized membrane protein required for colicin V production
MSIFLILDILLILLILLFIPIGFWRGPVKELYVTLGIFFGVLLADFWARPWGRDLSDVTELTEGAAAFIVAFAFLVAATSILGYGLGATLAPTYHALETKFLGAAIAAMNGTLLLSFSLQYVRLHLLTDTNEESLNDSFMARFLLDQVGWVLMVAAFVAVPLLLFVLISGRRAYDYPYDDYAYADEYVEDQPVEPIPQRRARMADAPTNVLPPRVPGLPVEDEPPYKAEPEPRRRRAAAETRPLVITEPQATREPAPPDEDEAQTRMGDTDPHIVLPLGGATEEAPPAALPAGNAESAEQAADAPAGSQAEGTEEDDATDANRDGLAPGYERCVHCHAVLPPDVSICPKCTTLR